MPVGQPRIAPAFAQAVQSENFFPARDACAGDREISLVSRAHLGCTDPQRPLIAHFPSGAMSMTDGTYYSGAWEEDQQNGWGRHVAPGRGKYEGGFKDGSRHGWGLAENQDGSTYQGACARVRVCMCTGVCVRACARARV